MRSLYRAIPSACAAILMFGSQVGPSDAELNLCKWPKAVLSGIPDHCLAGMSTTTFYILTSVMFVLGVIWLLLPLISVRIFPSKGTPTPRVSSKPFQLLIGSGSPFEEVEISGLNRSRVVRAKILNNTDTVISNGKLEVINLDPPYEYGGGNWLLKNYIIIPAHGYTFVDVASYAEGTSEHPPGAWISLIVPPSGGFFNSMPNLPIRSYKFHLRFSDISGASDKVFCRIYVDGAKRLHLEDWGDSRTAATVAGAEAETSNVPLYISLYEAARRIIDENIPI